MASDFLLYKYDICSAYRKVLPTMYSLFVASAIMIIQTIFNLTLLKGDYKYHSFRVRNVLVSFLYLIIWYEFAA